MKIFCDLDSVLCDFVGGCKQIFDWPVWDHEPLTDMRGHLKISNKEFWDKIDSYGERWWADLPPEDWADELVDIINQYDKEFIILTSPSLSHYAASGKVLWLQKFFKSKHFQRYIITPAQNKCLLAHKKAILIDDNDRNCKQFREKLGYTILLPQIWNENHKLVDQRLEHVKEQLRIISQYI